MLNIQDARSYFPLFQFEPDLAFLDSAASAQKPQTVLDAMAHFQHRNYANIHRGLYRLSQAATSAYEEARATVARFLNAPQPEHIIFTRNSTSAINMVAQTWAKANLRKGDAILLTVLEHHANIVPWQMLAEEKGLEILVADCSDDGHVTLDHIKTAWRANVKLVACSHMSNALGTLPEVETLIPFAHEQGAKVLVDGSQRVVHDRVDVQALGADFYVFTGHKVYGPTGIGVLYLAPSVAENIPPYEGGGDMISHVRLPMGTTYAPLPARLEAGTPAITEAVGLDTALCFLMNFDMQAIHTHEATLLKALREGLSDMPDITIYGATAPHAGVISFTLKGAHPQDVGMILDQCGVAVRTGHHCAEPLMDRLQTQGTLRASVGLYNTLADIEKLLAGLHQARKMLCA